MHRGRMSRAVGLVSCLGLFQLLGCAAAVPAAAAIGFVIAARTFLVLLGEAGVINVQANSPTPARAGGIATLPFTGRPVDRPGGAQLQVGTVRALPLNGTARTAQSMGLTGSATINVYCSDASSTNPCEDGVRVGSFRLIVVSGSTTVFNAGLDMPAAALAFLVSGEFGICFEATGDIDAQIVLDELSCKFGEDVGAGPVTAGNTPDDFDPDEPEPGPGPDPGPGPGPGPGPDPEPEPSGFIPAVVLHRGTEQLVAGPSVDSTISFAFNDDYSVDDLIFDTRNRSFALNGSGTRVWLRLFAPFPIEGQPRAQLWCMNTDGSGATRSTLPDDDLNSGVHLATDQDGQFCFANNFRIARMYRAECGQPAGPIFDYAGTLDFEANFRVNSDSSRMYLANIARFGGLPSIHTVDLQSSPFTPTIVLTNTALALEGVNPRNLAAMFDAAAFASAYVFRANYDSSTLTPRTQDVVYLGQGFSAASADIITQTEFTDSPYDLQVTDDGETIAYCLPPDDTSSGVNNCVVESVLDGQQWMFSDGRTRLGDMVLADGGSRVYYRTNSLMSGGVGVLQEVGTDIRRPAGTQVFGGTGWANVQLSDDGRTLVSAIGPGLYCLKDDASPPADLPNITALSYRFNDDCTLTVRVTLATQRGIARVFVNPYIEGVDPTLVVEDAENPFFGIRGGGGVNQSTRFTQTESSPDTWEYTFGLTNNTNQCAQPFLTSDFILRVIVVDETETVTVFQDFAPQS